MDRTRSHALAWNGPLVTLLGLTLALAAGLLLTRLTPATGVVVVALCAAGVATLVEPLVGLSAALFLGPLRAYLQAEVPQLPSQIGQAFVALTLAVWLARGLARRELRIPHPPLLVPILLFSGAALLSLWDAVELPSYGLPELLKWAQVVLLYLLVSDMLTPRRLPWLLGALLATALFQAAVGIWQFGLRGTGPEHFAIVAERFYRAYGTFEQPNPYAGFIGLILPLAIGAIVGLVADRGPEGDSGRGGLSGLLSAIRARAPWLLALSVAAIALIVALGASWSRGAWLGTAAAASAMAIALPRRTHRGVLLVGLLVALAVTLIVSGLMPAAVTARLTGFATMVRFEDVRGVGINDANYAVIERLAHWQSGLEMFRANLWTGVGFGCYEPAYRRFALINWPLALGHAHNYYLTLAAETGLVGLVTYVVLWGAVLWQTWRATRRARGLQRGLAIGLLGAWTHLSVHHLLDNLYVNNVQLHIGVLLGLLAFILPQTNQQRDEP